MARKKQTKVPCSSLLELLDEIEKTHQFIFEELQRALTIRNDEEAIKRILRNIKGKLL